MPFYWRRRKRWYNPRSRFQRRRRTWRKPRKRFYTRRFTRRNKRRKRRRRRYKVRRKKKLITVKQWQPDSITNCKIKGVGVLVLGADGKQLVCYTNVKKAWTPPKTPGGGGFGCEQFSLGMLYEEYKFRNNIWTKTNMLKDLCRFMWVKFTFYRHPETDFIIAYDRQPPFDLDEYTYLLCHPQNMLLAKHKIILLSKSSKPNGRVKKTKKIKPPKLMLTKWFFQKQFADYPLLQLKASAANFQYAHLGCCNTNQITTFFYLNTGFYQQGNWAYAGTETHIYQPYIGIPHDVVFWSKVNPTTTDWPRYGFQPKPQSYNDSISYDKGFFNPKVLQAKSITRDTTGGPTIQANMPTNVARYNPNRDSGKKSAMWLKSTLVNSYDRPTSDLTLIFQGYPLWMMLYGWLSYIQYIKKASDFFNSHVIILQSDAIETYASPGATNFYIPISNEFYNGKPPYEEPLDLHWRRGWFPNIYDQLPILNAIVESGPYVPKYDQSRNSTWELHYFYQFFFKWGGPEITDQPVADPLTQHVYPQPSGISNTIQIRNPAKQSYESILHSWDYRRGFIKKSAIKRMAEHLSIDSTFQEGSTPQKKRKVKGPCLTEPQEEDQEVLSCLQELCKENTYQEIQETNLKQLIQQQQQQQEQLKWNLLKIISDLKEKQRLLQLQTGCIS
nr:MAG: ORF1 [Torque teno midi virus]